MSVQEKILVAATIAHLLEYIDKQDPLDLAAAQSTLAQSGLIDFAEENPVMLPLRRDGVSQAVRFAG